MDTTQEIMTPNHEKWEEFCTKLAGEGACNFRQDTHGDWVWTCRGGNDQTFAKEILPLFDGVDVEGSLEYFSAHGGHCDCEILFNVDN